MWLMMQQDDADDYVLATGETTLVRDFVAHAFAEADIDLAWSGEGVAEKGTCTQTGKVLVEVDPRYFRLTEVELLLGDPTKAKEKLGWVHKTKWQELCTEMVQADLVTVAREQRRNADNLAPAPLYDLARLVAEVVGFTGEIVRDTSKPDGTPRKPMSGDKLRGLGWAPRVNQRNGVERVYKTFAGKTSARQTV